MFKFDRVACVTLDRRDDRWREFEAQVPQDWNLGEIKRYSAIDGKLCQCPGWWNQGGGAWGCYRSHMRILEDALNNDEESVFFLEDDARFCENFVEKAQAFMAALPKDWGLIYFGGQHLKASRHPPVKINDLVYTPYNVNRTHAFAIRGRRMMTKIYKHLSATKEWRNGQHIDHHLGRLHQLRSDPIFVPHEWLVAQGAGKSNINGRTFAERVWNHAERINGIKAPFYIVLGTHRSGSSCLAMVMHKLGVHMGNKLVGAERRHGGGGEAHELHQIVTTSCPFPSNFIKIEERQLRNRLNRMLLRMSNEANKRETVAGLKYPQLCLMAATLYDMLGENMRVVAIDRPIEESIASMQDREPHVDPKEVEEHQRHLHQTRGQFLAEFPGPVHTVNYHEMLDSPMEVVSALAQFVERPVTTEALAHINPEYAEHRGLQAT